MFRLNLFVNNNIHGLLKTDVRQNNTASKKQTSSVVGKPGQFSTAGTTEYFFHQSIFLLATPSVIPTCTAEVSSQ